jgi:tight adherence protein C
MDAPLIGLAGVVCVGVAGYGLNLVRAESPVEQRELAGVRLDTNRRAGPIRRMVNLTGARFGPRLLDGMTPSRREAVVHRLDRAGRPGDMDLARYAELRAAALVFTIVVAVFFALLGDWLVLPILLAAGLFGVDAWISRTGRHRQERLERDIPDLIDILSVTVRAGAGYRAALERVAESLQGPPAEEMLLTLRQMDLGVSRREAFQALRERNDSTTLANFVTAQLQAEELGVPLADALAAIASDTRKSAAQNARRRAQRSVPRVSLITSTLLLPATMLLIVVGLLIGSAHSVSSVL